MNSRFRYYVISVSLLIFAIAIPCSAQKNDGGGRLAGTWDTIVSLTNCATGDVLATFRSTGSFNQGGTFYGITSGIPPAGRSPEIGVWKHEMGNRYGFRFKAFLFDATGMPTAYQLVRHTVELNDDNLNYVSYGEARIFAMNGMQIGAGCSTAVGTRMLVD